MKIHRLLNRVSRQPSWFLGWGTIIMGWGLVGCQTPPTKIFQSRPVRLTMLESKASQPLKLTPDTVVLDARSPFDYSLAHVAGSFHVEWQAFAEQYGRGPYPGRVSSDTDGLRRRLVQFGISKSTPVLVVDQGPNQGPNHAHGAAGRVAWTLLYLGVQDVQTARSDMLSRHYSNYNSPPRAPGKMWHDPVVSALAATRSEVVSAVVSPSKNSDIKLIDVRSKNEYFKKQGFGENYELPNLNTIHMDWRHFFTTDGRPNFAMIQELAALKIKPHHRIIVLSNKGVRSAAVNYALLAIGFSKASHFPGGLIELIKETKGFKKY